MAELDSTARLAQEILAVPDDGFYAALKIADGMSISHVKEALEEHVAPADSAPSPLWHAPSFWSFTSTLERDFANSLRVKI